MRFQIRDDHFGYAIIDAPTARSALAAFFADRARAEVNGAAVASGPTATVERDGGTFVAVPVVEPAPA